jgi:hypothetical protein
MAKGWDIDARNHYIAMRRLQEPQLFDNPEQEETPGPAGTQEVLQEMPSPHGP